LADSHNQIRIPPENHSNACLKPAYYSGIEVSIIFDAAAQHEDSPRMGDEARARNLALQTQMRTIII
jgi:hypothetical protein